MISVRTAKGYDLPIQGTPLETSERLASPATVAVLPEHIPFIKPRLAVYSHIVPSVTTAEDLVGPTRRFYDGPLEVGQ